MAHWCTVHFSYLGILKAHGKVNQWFDWQVCHVTYMRHVAVFPLISHSLQHWCGPKMQWCRHSGATDLTWHAVLQHWFDLEVDHRYIVANHLSSCCLCIFNKTCYRALWLTCILTNLIGPSCWAPCKTTMVDCKTTSLMRAKDRFSIFFCSFTVTTKLVQQLQSIWS